MILSLINILILIKQSFHIEMEEKSRPRSMKTNAFVAIVLATGAITSCMISFPIIFTYIQSFESHVQTELDLCKVKFIH